MTLQDLKSLFPVWELDINHGIDRRKNKATNKGHIHKHNSTWRPKTLVSKTHAYYRRHHLSIPTRSDKN